MSLHSWRIWSKGCFTIYKSQAWNNKVTQTKAKKSRVAEYARRRCVFRAWTLNAHEQEREYILPLSALTVLLSQVYRCLSIAQASSLIWDWTTSPFLLWRPVIQASLLLSHLFPHSKHLFDIFPLSSLWSLLWLSTPSVGTIWSLTPICTIYSKLPQPGLFSRFCFCFPRTFSLIRMIQTCRFKAV